MVTNPIGRPTEISCATLSDWKISNTSRVGDPRNDNKSNKRLIASAVQVALIVEYHFCISSCPLRYACCAWPDTFQPDYPHLRLCHAGGLLHESQAHPTKASPADLRRSVFLREIFTAAAGLGCNQCSRILKLPCTTTFSKMLPGGISIVLPSVATMMTVPFSVTPRARLTLPVIVR